MTGVSVNSYVDTTAKSGTAYSYEVAAFAGPITSQATAAATVTTLLATPASLTATPVGAFVSLAWVAKDAAATGYNVLRSSDGVTFTQLTKVSGGATSYVDNSTAAGQTYFYQVQACTDTNTSAACKAVMIALPQGNASGVQITTRFGNELVITASGVDDTVSLTQSGSTLTIDGDGQTFTETIPAAGVFLYTRGGGDSIQVDQTVTAPLTIDSIDGANTLINTAGTNVTAWIDSTDSLTGTASTHSVANFAGGVSKAAGASLALAHDAGATSKANLSLFGTGPVAADVNQGQVGDCYFLSSLAAFAGANPKVLTQSAVDMGDGTYAVQFYKNGSPVYVRVSNMFSNSFARAGANNTIWALVLEKAFAYFRTGANTYASINGGWMGEVYSDLGVKSTGFTPSATSDGDLSKMLSQELANGQAVTFGTQNAPNLVKSHAYTLVGVTTDAGGVNHYTVRNPWGASGQCAGEQPGVCDTHVRAVDR